MVNLSVLEHLGLFRHIWTILDHLIRMGYKWAIDEIRGPIEKKKFRAKIRIFGPKKGHFSVQNII